MTEPSSEQPPPDVPTAEKGELAKPDGVLVLDKPRGPTSHDIVARVRRLLKTREVGQAGTLGPMATGVLVLAIGEATKLVQWLTAEAKAYRATIRLGVSTTTLDAEGEIVETRPVSAIDRDTLSRAIEAERARTEQIPPVVSAIKIGGVAAHRRVRRGEELTLAPRPVAVSSLEVREVRDDPPEIDVSIACAKGYYVRSLARDLAERLGTFGHLTSLRRMRSGSFAIDDALPFAFDRLDRAFERETLLAALMPLPFAAAHVLGRECLTDAGLIKARHGKRIHVSDFTSPPAQGTTAFFHGDVVVAIGEVAGDEARVIRGFRAH